MVKMSYYTDYSNYTDFHGVDEDSTTVSQSGGWWHHGDHTGIAHRDMGDYIGTSDSVASMCRTIQKKNKHHSPSLEGE